MDNPVQERKTLKTSLDKLNGRISQLEELSILSSQLLNKFINPRNEPMNKEGALLEKERQPENIVELFDDVSKKMSRNIDVIGANLEKVLSMID